MFTFSFGSAMAATSYSLDDYSTALTAEKNAQIGYLNSAKAQAIGTIAFDAKTGLSTDGFAKAAYEAAAEKVVKDATTLMDAKINEVLNGTFPTTTAPSKAVVALAYTSVKGDLTVAGNMLTAIKAETDTLNKVQAPLTKAAVEAKLAVDFSKYDSTTKAYEGDTLTAVQYIQKAIDTAKKAIAAADKETTDAAKISGYNAALSTFESTVNPVPTKEDQAIADDATSKTVEQAVNAYIAYGVDAVYPIYNAVGMAADATEDFSDEVAGDYKAFWEADKVTANKGKFFGVEVANITKVTRAEVVAVNNALYNAITASKEVVLAYADSVADVEALYVVTVFDKYESIGKISTSKDYKAKLAEYGTLYYWHTGKNEIREKEGFTANIEYYIATYKDVADKAAFLATLSNAMKVADKYADVVAAGELMKKEYVSGVKTYDDAAVDAAVKAAEELVYADLGGTLKTNAADYITAAAAAEDITLEVVNYELQKFNKAVADAKAKFIDAVVVYGDKATAEADKVYAKDQYADNELKALGADKYDEIKAEALADLDDAQSYAEIEAIMADAAAELAKLAKNADEAEVYKAQGDYAEYLDAYKALQAKYVDTTKVTGTQLEEILADGKALINKAVTVDAVKAAYEEAKALFNVVKTDKELADAKEAIEKQIAALPYTSALTAADKATVVAVYDAYVAHMETPGAADVANKALLVEKYNKVNELEAKAIEAEAKALNDKLAKLSGSDADLEAKAALKAEAEAVVAKAEALKDEIAAVDEDAYIDLAAAVLTEADKLDAVDFAATLANLAVRKLQIAGQPDATQEEVQAAIAAYNALTDKQKYELEETVLPLIKVVEAKVDKFDDVDAKAYLQDLSVKARSVKTAKGNVKVTVVADVDVLLENGYAVEYKFYRSEASNKGFGKAKKVSEEATYTNTSGVKGTKYFYKAVIVAKNAEGEVVASTPLKHCLYASRTWSK